MYQVRGRGVVHTVVILWTNLKYHLEAVSIDGRLVLKWIFQEMGWDGMVHKLD